jgi:NAD(P)-dependent dehydrogenase (short-subunit alcohol dehydrogenase family)
VIGRAASARFAADGAKVVAVDLPGYALDVATSSLRESSAEVVSVVADVTQAEDVRRYFAAAVETFGGVDFFINNAGIEGAVAPLVDYPDDAFDRVMLVNVKGVWLGLKAAAPLLRDRDKLAEHGISPQEVEELVGPGGVYAVDVHPDYPDQVRVTGQTRAGRFITVALEETETPGVWRPVTGWSSSDAEEAYYWREHL